MGVLPNFGKVDYPIDEDKTAYTALLGPIDNVYNGKKVIHTKF